MKIQFKDKVIHSHTNRWCVSGYVDTEANVIKTTRIEGDINDPALPSVLLKLALELNP